MIEGLMKNSRLAKGLLAGCSLGLVTTFTLPMTASADVDQCGDLLICIDISVPGDVGGSGTGSPGGGTGGTGGGGVTNPFEDPNVDPITGFPIDGDPQDPVVIAPTPAEVAAQARSLLALRKPTVHMNPSEGNLGLVGLPVWLWIDSTDPHQWSPEGISKTLTIQGVTVTVTARSPLITWNMGDGLTKECTVAGRPYQGVKEDSNFDCTYKYGTTSQREPQNKFTVSATVTWKTSYTGPTGTFALDDLSGTAGTTVRVGELQVMN